MECLRVRATGARSGVEGCGASCARISGTTTKRNIVIRIAHGLDIIRPPVAQVPIDESALRADAQSETIRNAAIQSAAAGQPGWQVTSQKTIPSNRRREMPG